MQTIIVEIFVPAISASFDFRLPSTGKIGDIIDEVARILESTQQNLSLDAAQLVLCDLDRDRRLRREDTVAESGLKDGSELMLV